MADRRYYTEGSSARQLNNSTRSGRRESRAGYVGGAAAPARRPQPERRQRPDRDPQPVKRVKKSGSHLTDAERRALAARKAERRAVTNAQIRYTTGMVVAIVIAVALCCYLLKLTSDVKVEKESVASLKSQVTAQVDENTSYSAGLDSMTDLDEIYKIATTKLGMVYSQPGQTLYYSQNSDDYVVQYKDVPGAK